MSGYAPLSTRTAIVAVLVLAAGILNLVATGLVGLAEGREPSTSMALMLGFFGLALLGTFVLAVIAVLAWQSRATANAWALRPGPLRFRPGWSLLWWFVPALNLVTPCIAFAELWRSSDPERLNGPVDPSWRHSSLTGLVPAWWATFILSGLLGRMSSVRDGEPDAIGWGLASAALAVVAAACLVAIVRAVDRRQAELARRVAAAPAVAMQ